MGSRTRGPGLVPARPDLGPGPGPDRGLVQGLDGPQDPVHDRAVALIPEGKRAEASQSLHQNQTLLPGVVKKIRKR